MVTEKDYKKSVSLNNGNLVYLARLKIRSKSSVETIKIRSKSEKELNKNIKTHMKNINEKPTKKKKGFGKQWKIKKF